MMPVPIARGAQPATKLVCGDDSVPACLFVAAFAGVRTTRRSRLRITARETPGKEQETEAHAVERCDDPGSLPQAAVTPQLAARVPAAEGLIRREQDAMVQP